MWSVMCTKTGAKNVCTFPFLTIKKTNKMFFFKNIKFLYSGWFRNPHIELRLFYVF